MFEDILRKDKPDPNNICIKCRKPFYWWFHGQGMVCPKCVEKEECERKCLKIY